MTPIMLSFTFSIKTNRENLLGQNPLGTQDHSSYTPTVKSNALSKGREYCYFNRGDRNS